VHAEALALVVAVTADFVFHLSDLEMFFRLTIVFDETV
jgi:hypothetical protein